MTTLFACYISEDYDSVRPVLEQFRSAGFKVSDYQTHPEHGSIEDILQSRIDAADYVLLFLSRAALKKSGPYAIELDCCRAKRKKAGSKHEPIIPILLEECELPRGFKDLTSWQGPEEFRRLQEWLSDPGRSQITPPGNDAPPRTVARLEDRLSKTDKRAAKLDLAELGLDRFPEQVFQWEETLTVLQLCHNRIREIPDSIVRLKHLAILDLEGNELTSTSFPPDFGNLNNTLVVLDLEMNHLTRIPEAIFGLQELSCLYLGSNYLTSIPDSIGRLASLQELGIQDNQLIRLPHGLADLQRLTRIILHENPFELPPRRITMQGWDAIRAYLQDRPHLRAT